VNGVQWIDHIDGPLLVSIGADKKLIVWSCAESDKLKEHASWSGKVYEGAHADAINYLSCLTVDKEIYITTMCTGGVLKLWKGSNKNDIAFKDQLLFGKHLQEAAALKVLNDKSLVLVIGGYDTHIHVYLVPRAGGPFSYKFSLLGHTNSIRAFDFKDEGSVKYLVSAS